ncbi:xanthine dehydrogenase family protein molybdopterin-binding subunit [Hyalangium minutum]|uniref:Periplasmic aromatic aldehyde oxidoreductase, molybdenum binding subunit YagR n=1 Tax=Hyalangium minutum TaxID=394096 RepID=A0A085W9A6_9BACT|nr:xanthine dehydrogenase family protein molybdopterin-binding subunit [Hyalangium minutum]KFE64269.1 Periplasmic aromatic aldehyde oxidoreductase, molybdenum binding subunit YagR [Hyalangium minutum]
MQDVKDTTGTQSSHKPASGQQEQTPGPQKPPAPNPGPARQQAVPYGIVGQGLKEVTRRVPLDEPPPLPENAKLKSIGKPVTRLDAVEKVTGKARYTFDVQLPGMLWAKWVASPLPHARIKSVDTSAAERAPGVRAVHVLERLLSTAKLRDPKAEQSQRYPTIRYAGQPIAAVAADTPRAAEAAAKLIRVEYEPLPHVTEIEAAMKENAPRVFPGPTEQPATAGGGGAPPGLPQKGNVRGPDTKPRGMGPRGDVEQGFRESDVIIEAEFRTQVQTHVPMEPHGLVADWRDEGLTLYASTQYVGSVRDEAAENFDLPKNKVRVICDFTGGGFGAKYGIGNYGLLAIHLSRKARLPVRMMLDRREEHVSGGNRPNSIQRLKLGAKRDGSLTALQLQAHGSGGVAGGAGVGFAHSTLYACPNVRVEQYDVFTNAGPCAAFRAPGQVQGIFSLEQAIDELAERIGMDPLALRSKIDVSGTDDSLARAQERRIGAERFGWNKRRPAGSDKGPIKRGIGFAQSQWLYLVHLNTACEVRVSGDGSVEAFSSTQDIGTGTRTVLAQVVAEEFGLRPEDIGARVGDSRYPMGPASGGSRVTSSLTPAARNAAYRCARELANRLARVLEANAEDIAFADGKVVVKGQASKTLPFREAVKKAGFEEISQRAERRDDYEGFAASMRDMGISKHGIGGVQFAEVAVDTETGIVKVERVVAVHDCGRPINPKLTESQIYGGVIQGVSYALYEERHLDSASGLQLNANVDQYKIVGSREVPQIEVHLLEQLGGQSSTDARGVAEPANVATAAAVANAFYNATGKRIRTLPMTPANVLAALRA